VRIRPKIIFVVLPLVVVPLFLIGFASTYTARNGITRVASSFLRFKAEEISKYAQSQWTLLQDNGLAGRPDFVAISKDAVRSFAGSMIRDDAELIFAVDRTGAVSMTTSPAAPNPDETRVLADLGRAGAAGWQQVRVGSVERVGYGVSVAPFGWYLLVTSTRESFYSATNQIVLQGVVILAVSAVLAIALLVAFTGSLTRPLRALKEAMTGVIASRDLSRRVAIQQNDETGDLGRTFNRMTGELERAYEQIKGYALETAIARNREQKIRNIFQRYVPHQVIDTIFQNPDRMLMGDNRVLAVMFSDIRGFTAISERMRPEELVQTLNTYFGTMVDIISAHGGIVDKYMGDAIMAFFGAPVQHDDDAYQSVLAGLDMLEALAAYNVTEQAKGRPGFRVGIGINYGLVTVGNIGSEKKMDYTVIGDMVNIASRLEGLTKIYLEEAIFSESIFREVGTKLPFRMLDRVAVKGRTGGIDIYTARKSLGTAEQEAWGLHAMGLELYFKGEFEKAEGCFSQVQKLLPHDAVSAMFFERCALYRSQPPEPDWDGVQVILEK
jgi:adenylate cyclase